MSFMAHGHMFPAILCFVFSTSLTVIIVVILGTTGGWYHVRLRSDLIVSKKHLMDMSDINCLGRVTAVIGKTKWNLSVQAADDYYKQTFERLLNTRKIIPTILKINRADVINAGASLIVTDNNFAQKTDKDKIDVILMKILTPYMNPTTIILDIVKVSH